jgi:hypothetical protein
MDIERITHPLRLARGSHRAGSGKGCAMNVLSWMMGDQVITDFPECSARPLASLVQTCNDAKALTAEFLSPQDSILVLDLAWRTVGTAKTLHPSRLSLWVFEVNAALAKFGLEIRCGDVETSGFAFTPAFGHNLDCWAGGMIELTRFAIDRWRELAGLDQPEDISTDDINTALGKMLCTQT